MTSIAQNNLNLLPRKSWIYLGYWTVFVLFVGMLIGTQVLYLQAPDVPEALEEDHSTHLTHDHTMHSERISVPAATAPKLSIDVVKDSSAGWNLFVQTENFAFTPENANAADVANQGHAHIYVDGEKVARLYGPSYHLSDLAPGPHVVEVSLNGNSHAVYEVDGVEVSAQVEIIQPE